MAASRRGHCQQHRLTLANAPLRPRLGLKANVISGDDDPNDRDLQTFNTLFPKRRYFGELSLLGPYNSINLHPSIDVNPRRRMVTQRRCGLLLAREHRRWHL
jgi:hypothetical protein